MFEMLVKDMSCGHCVAAVTRAVKSVDASATVEVNLQTKQVRVESVSDHQAIMQALAAAGYPATPST